jgi:hypothetical protein
MGTDERTARVIRLQRYPGGVAQGVRTALFDGHQEVVSAGPNAEFAFIGSDPYGTAAYTGLVVPEAPSSAIGGARYLFMLARASFNAGEQSSDNRGVRLAGIRQYAELVARIPAGTGPLAPDVGPPAGSTVTFRREIREPFWHPLDGDISWHVMIVGRSSQRDARNPANADGLVYQDSASPALLYQTLGPYVPPNAGRPWGTPVTSSLGSIHELRFRWRDRDNQRVVDVPINPPCDVALFASVRQNNPATNPVFTDEATLTPQFGALTREDQFVVAYAPYAQYGIIAGSLIFDQNLGEDVP